jgi:hypothetical protein
MMKAADLLAKIKQQEGDASMLRAYWESSLPVPPPDDYNLRAAVRRLPLDYLAKGIEAYLVQINKKEEVVAKGHEPALPVTTKNAMDYMCGAAWGMWERESPSEKYYPTARRIRNAERDPNSADWDSEAFHNATPEERQKIMAQIIAKQKARKP